MKKHVDTVFKGIRFKTFSEQQLTKQRVMRIPTLDSSSLSLKPEPQTPTSLEQLVSSRLFGEKKERREKNDSRNRKIVSHYWSPSLPEVIIVVTKNWKLITYCKNWWKAQRSHTKLAWSSTKKQQSGKVSRKTKVQNLVPFIPFQKNQGFSWLSSSTTFNTIRRADCKVRFQMFI